MNNNQPKSPIDFLIRMGIWGGLGYVAGLRGSSLNNWSFWGPVTEQVFGYSLEDFATALEQERLKKEIKEVTKKAIEEATTNLAERLK